MALTKIEQAKLELAESMLKGLLTDLPPTLFVIALNNVCAHGEVFKENHHDFLDDHDYFLQDWFKGIQVLQCAITRHKTNFNEKVADLTDEIDGIINSNAHRKISLLTRQREREEIMKKYKTHSSKFESKEDENALRVLKATLTKLKTLK